jgi:hypothetical protein
MLFYGSPGNTGDTKYLSAVQDNIFLLSKFDLTRKFELIHIFMNSKKHGFAIRDFQQTIFQADAITSKAT